LIDPRKEVFSEATVFLWLALTVASLIVCMLIGAVLIYLIYDCWPIARQQLGNGICLSKIQPPILQFLPIIAGIALGTVLTAVMKK
jgi:hypothetical protein